MENVNIKIISAYNSKGLEDSINIFLNTGVSVVDTKFTETDSTLTAYITYIKLN